jgi:hypothetical protein
LLLDELEKNFPKDYQAYKKYRNENTEAKDGNNDEKQ